MAQILVVDDDDTICSAFKAFLEDEGHEVLIAGNARDALDLVKKERPGMIFMDVRMPGMNGIDALERIRGIDPQLPVIIMTAYGTSQTSIDAVRLGAFEYLTKPLDLDDVRKLIKKVLKSGDLGVDVKADSRGSSETAQPVSLVGSSVAMREAYRMIGLLAANDVPALITGEVGVGKEVVARTIHANSRRKDRPFIAFDCSAFEEDSLEDALFGSGRGRESPRLQGNAFSRASRGTLFLTQIEALPLSMQARLSRLLHPQIPNEAGLTCRILAAAPDDPRMLVAEGTFSYELYEQLSVIQIHLPPLRMRKEDIPELVAHFLELFSKELGKVIDGVEEAALQRMMDYRWPGNVGQLGTTIKRACVLARGRVLTSDDIASSLSGPLPRPPGAFASSLELAVQQALQRYRTAETGESAFHLIVGEVEKVLVREALTSVGGNQVRAAELLGVNRTTLRKKIELYDL